MSTVTLAIKLAPILLSIDHPENFLELIQNPYFYGPGVGMIGLLLACNWMNGLKRTKR